MNGKPILGKAAFALALISLSMPARADFLDWTDAHEAIASAGGMVPATSDLRTVGVACRKSKDYGELWFELSEEKVYVMDNLGKQATRDYFGEGGSLKALKEFCGQ